MNHIYKVKTITERNDSLENPPKDKGFTEGKVLVLVPNQSYGKTFIEQLITQHCHGKRKKISKISREKYSELLGDEDVNRATDNFKLGIALAQKKKLYLFTSFSKSDIILASPLSLQQLISSTDDASFLSSIDILIIQDAHMILMQNWELLEYVVSQCNLLPRRDSISTNIHRIKECFLEGKSGCYRQTIVTSEYITPTILSLFNRTPNVQGRIRTIEHYSSVLPAVPIQKFRKFEVGSLEEVHEKRLGFFKDVYWPGAKEGFNANVLIFISSYFEYLRVKGLMEEINPDVLFVSEYTARPERQRSLDFFKHKKNRILCVTERLLFYKKLHFSQIENIVFYSLPDNPIHYSNLVSLSKETHLLFCKFDGHAVQRIVGDNWANQLLSSPNDTFSLV